MEGMAVVGGAGGSGGPVVVVGGGEEVKGYGMLVKLRGEEETGVTRGPSGSVALGGGWPSPAWETFDASPSISVRTEHTH